MRRLIVLSALLAAGALSIAAPTLDRNNGGSGLEYAQTIGKALVTPGYKNDRYKPAIQAIYDELKTTSK
jgi:hypothetical protein